MQQAMLQQAQVMSVMFDLRKSKFGFEETISTIKSARKSAAGKSARCRTCRPGCAKPAPRTPNA
jgi:hypothetical protein